MDLIVEDVKGKCTAQPRDMLRMAVNHSSLDMPICIPFTNAEHLTGEMFASVGRGAFLAGLMQQQVAPTGRRRTLAH